MSAHFALLHPRQIVALRGPDRIRFLNGQITNDCRTTSPSTQIPACILSAKGKLQFTIHVSVTADSLLCDAPAHRDGPTLLDRLDRYLIADQAELEDLSEKWTILHFPDHPEPRITFPDGALTFPSRRLGSLGTDVWLPSTSLSEWADRPERLTEPEIVQRRISHGIPEWGHELDEDTLPAEVGLDRTHVDFHKGCYIGQEVVSRIKSVGRVNRHLVHIASDHPLTEGTPLISHGRECGRVTTAAVTMGPWHALALLHRSADPTELVCGKHPVTVSRPFGG